MSKENEDWIKDQSLEYLREWKEDIEGAQRAYSRIREAVDDQTRRQRQFMSNWLARGRLHPEIRREAEIRGMAT